MKVLKQSFPWVRTTETSKDNPRAPSQATKARKKSAKKTSGVRFLRHVVISQKILNIINSSLSKALRRCFRLDTKAVRPHRALIKGGEVHNHKRIVIGFNSLTKTLVL